MKGTSLGVRWLRLGFPTWWGRFDPWLGSYDSTCLEAKKPKQNRSRIVTSLIKTLKNGPHQKKKKKSLKENKIDGWTKIYSNITTSVQPITCSVHRCSGTEAGVMSEKGHGGAPGHGKAVRAKDSTWGGVGHNVCDCWWEDRKRETKLYQHKDSTQPGYPSALVLAVVAMVSSPKQAWLSVTSWTVTRQAPLSMGLSRQEHWSRLPFPSPPTSVLLQYLTHHKEHIFNV